MRHDDKNPEIGDGEGHIQIADKAMAHMPTLSPTPIDDIRMAHRERCFHMEQRKRADLAIGSFLRTSFGWLKGGDPDANERAKEKAAALMEIGEADTVVTRLLAKCGGDEGQLKGHDKPALKRARAKIAVDEPDYFRFRKTILAAIAGRKAFDDVEEDATKSMREFSASLPVYDWWRENVFDDPLQLGVIVGEAGDLSKYPAPYHEEHPKFGQERKASAGPSCLWKRMGVAVIGAGNGEDDRRQGGLSKSASAEDWIEHGYNRKRRSKLFVIGDVLVKQQGRYRDIYLARKEQERRKAEAKGLIVAATASIPKKRAHEYMSLGHIDKRARRYMEKKLLRDLWKAWRRAEVDVAERPARILPAASNLRDAA
jgi:hypothetical protein